MENNESKVVTFEDLVKYTEEVLFPGLEDIMDEKLNAFGTKTDKRFESMDNRFGSIDQQLVNIQAELLDIKSEISAIKGELNNIKVKLERLEKMVEGDARMYVAEIAELKEANQEITKRLLILENKRT
jgi:DNA repair ATPase RecN